MNKLENPNKTNTTQQIQNKQGGPLGPPLGPTSDCYPALREENGFDPENKTGTKTYLDVWGGAFGRNTHFRTGP